MGQVWLWIVVTMVVSVAHAGKKPAEEKLPVHVGIVPGQKEVQVRFEQGTSVGTVIKIRDGDLVVKLEAGRVMVDFKGSTREPPAVELLAGKKVVLDFEDVADQKALRTMTITRGDSPDEIVVNATLQPLKVKYSVKGTLTRK